MSLTTSYMTTTKNLEAMFNAIQGAKAPPKFTQTFLETLGFKNKTDRLLIAVLKGLGFLTEAGEPSQRYYEFLDQSEGPRVLAEAIEEAYADLFQVNKTAYNLSAADVKNKLRTLTQGQYSDAVLGWMANTFTALSSLADFQSGPRQVSTTTPEPESADLEPPTRQKSSAVPIKNLQYVINIQLPESRDPAVYDALFRSLRDHLEIG